MGKRSRRRGARTLKAPESEYRCQGGDVLALRGAMTPAARAEYAARWPARRLSQEDAWQRGVEFLFERLVVRWEIAGAEPIASQKELLGPLPLRRHRTSGAGSATCCASTSPSTSPTLEAP